MPSGQGSPQDPQVLGALCLYALILEHLGFALTTFLFMVLVLKLEPRRWTFILPARGNRPATAFFFLLFKVLLRVPLPPGNILGY